MLFGSLVELHALLHSYLYFFLLEKLFLCNLDTSSTLPRHLAICQALKLFLIAISTDPRQLGGSIGKVPGPLIASRQLVDRSSFCYYVFALFLDTFSTVAFVDVIFLDTFLDRWLDTSICRELLRIYIQVLCYPDFISLDLSLSIPLSPYLPNHSLSLQTTFPSDFQGFSSLGKFLISHFHAFHVLKPRFWGFLKNFGVFQN